MNLVLYLLMMAMMAVMMTKNIRMLKRAKHNRNYVQAYDAILKEEPDAYQKVVDYLASEDHPEYLNKGLILRLLLELDVEGDGYKQTLDLIDFDELFLTNGKLDKEKMTINSDVFMWVALALCKAVDFELDDVSDAIHEKFNKYSGIMNYALEYHLVQAIYACVNNKGDYSFLTALLEGDYPAFKYDKRMIGLYKRLAASALAYRNQLTDEYYQNDLYEFVKTTMGRLVLKALDLYEIYISNAEVVDEVGTDEAAAIETAEETEEPAEEAEDKEE